MNKYILILTPITAILASCSPQAACDSPTVKDQLSELAKSDVRLVSFDIARQYLLAKLANEASNRPVREGNTSRAIDISEVEQQFIKSDAERETVRKNVHSTVTLSLENIITEYKDDKTGFISCKADFRGESPGYGWIVKKSLQYQIEKTSDGNLVVTANY